MVFIGSWFIFDSVLFGLFCEVSLVLESEFSVLFISFCEVLFEIVSFFEGSTGITTDVLFSVVFFFEGSSGITTEVLFELVLLIEFSWVFDSVFDLVLLSVESPIVSPAYLISIDI